MHKTTRNDCEKVIERLLKIFSKSGLKNKISFFVYGSYFERWREGLSDLDAMIYFSFKDPLKCLSQANVSELQAAVRDIYKEFPFTKTGHFFADVFILDELHGTDGRFFIFDKEKIDGFKTQADAKLMLGQPFLNKLKPVSLRHEQEIELAHGLHNLRNYLFFEIPRGATPESLSKARGILKYFGILPRRVSIINGGPMIKTPDVFKKYDYLKRIDYAPFMDFWENTSNPNKLEIFIKKWHKPNSDVFRKCLECFEKTLIALVKNTQMLSRY